MKDNQKQRPLDKIAAEIAAHLKRFEGDPTINTRSDKTRLLPYFGAYSWSGGRFVYVRYVSFQGQSHLTRTEAEQYLAWLDAGNVGSHREAL